MNSLLESFKLAVQHHQAGDLQQAEQFYRQVLQADPAHVGALHLLGVLAHQLGRNDQAVDYIRQALVLQPEFPEACNNLGMALQAQGKLAEAVASYEKALRLQPDLAEAYNNMGNALKDQGKLAEAIGSYEQALRLKPDYAEARYNLGTALQGQGKLPEAISKYQQSLRLKPAYPEAHNNLGNALKNQGNIDDAIAHYRQALRLKPDYAEAHYNLGHALRNQAKIDDAITHYRQAVSLRPDHAEAYNNLGNALADQGKIEEAIGSYRQALSLKPDHAEVYNNLGSALKCQRKIDEAITHYRQALRLKPDYAEACNNLGIALTDQGKIDEAIATYQQALRLKPDYAETYNNLGIALTDQGKIEEAIASCQQALRLKPDYAEAYNNLGNALKDRGMLQEAVTCYQQALHRKPDYAAAYNNLGNALKDQGMLDEAIESVRAALRFKPESAVFHSNLVNILHYHPHYDSAALLKEARLWNDRYAEPLARFRQPHVNNADPQRRLRIGYVSPDFRNHVVSKFMMPLLSHHDHREVEIFCYAEVACPDDMTERLRALADIWRTTVGLTDEQVADMVRNDRIDILVDLALHTANNRLLVFARKPAPVQVTWLGYPGTTGLSTIDYRLTDPYFDPPGLGDTHSSEESVRLPDCFWCYEPQNDEPALPDLPARRNGFLTLGCLNNVCKTNDALLALWAKVLQALPHARLLLVAPSGPARDHVSFTLQQEGLASQRVEFVDKQSHQEYLRTYNRIDLCLDTAPCNGGATSLDALWMGVPLITLVGETVVGRAGWSLLCNLDLRELAARTPDEYVALAVKLAGDLPRLRELHATLRSRMLASPLMDGNRFARNMERAYRQMWRRWCQTSAGRPAAAEGRAP